jgi:thioredoxin-related protein
MRTNTTAQCSIARRRILLAGAAALVASRISVPSARAAAPTPGPDGLYGEPWLLSGVTDLGKAHAEATTAGKRFIILWEMRGCAWCKMLHVENFAKPNIANYIQENFSVVQLDLNGAREVLDFDSEKASEQALSAKYEVNSTPTVQFFMPGVAAERGRELGRVGYLKPNDFALMLHFVQEKAYEDGPFDEWAKKRG